MDLEMPIAGYPPFGQAGGAIPSHILSRLFQTRGLVSHAGI
jgi:hypothetical protein